MVQLAESDLHHLVSLVQPLLADRCAPTVFPRSYKLLPFIGVALVDTSVDTRQDKLIPTLSRRSSNCYTAVCQYLRTLLSSQVSSLCSPTCNLKLLWI